MSRELIDSVKQLLRHGLTAEQYTQARAEIQKEDHARSEAVRGPLLKDAVQMLRRGESSSDVEDMLERAVFKAGIAGFISVPKLLAQASTRLGEQQDDALAAAKEVAANGGSLADVASVLGGRGFSPWDAGVVAHRIVGEPNGHQ